MTLSISVLGPLVIESGDCRLGKVPKKARALLAFLASQAGQPVTRERLADLLWPYQGQEQARHSLRNCLLELRKALGRNTDPHLVADFATCRIQDAIVDLDAFERLSRSQHCGDLQSAAELYRGEFLADFDINSEPFQEWLSVQRDRTLAVVCDLLHRLSELQNAAGDHDAAIQSGRRLVMLDSLSEFGQRALIRAYAQAGRRGEALRQYKSCAETLKRELGVAPDVETQLLANEISRSNGAREHSLPGPTVEDPEPAARASTSDRLSARRAPSRADSAREGTTTPRWPCLLPNIAVAVAPVRNLTGDPDQQFLVEAFTEDLVTDLLRHGRGLCLRPLSDDRSASDGGNRIVERGYDYIVTGSAQTSAPGLLRVNMRITDAATSEYLWAGRHEFKPEDLAPIQTRITRRISRELHVLLLQAASRRALAKSRQDVGITECLSEASSALKGKITPELTAQAQTCYLTALAQDPRNVEALTGLALTCQTLVSNPWWGDPRAAAAASDLGREAVAIALDLAPGNAVAKLIQGMLYSAGGQLELAERAFAQALGMDHGLGAAHGFAGYNAALLGRADETWPAIERAMRLDHTDRRHSIWFFFAGFAELLLGRTETAIELLEKSLERNPSYGAARLFLMAALSLIGREADATETAASFRKQYPDYRTTTFEQLWLSRSGSSTYRLQIHPLFEKIRNLGVAN
ncbi:MAG: winged helix-turn-helix domain-containing protein [Alphaproteobacteria bacterium]|nr:winged helix-turn-helix domain-containing protein [Alphaproteobacteria bacterium]